MLEPTKTSWDERILSPAEMGRTLGTAVGTILRLTVLLDQLLALESAVRAVRARAADAEPGAWVEVDRILAKLNADRGSSNGGDT